MADLTPETFVSMLETRAETSELGVGQEQLEKVQEVKDMFARCGGTVEGVVTGWVADIKPVAEAVFGLTLPADPILELGRHALYQPTVFEGVHGRLLANTIDEIMGPGFSLDMTAEPLSTITEGPNVWPVAQGLFFNMYMLPRLKE